MKFGLFLGIWENPHAQGSQHRILHQVMDYAIRAEALGFQSVFLTEHHFTGLPQIPSSLTVLSYLAAKTTRLRLGTALIILPWHNPLLLAEQIGTLDLLSNGRVDCGVGRGFRYVECRGFGVPGEELAERFEEGLDVLMKCWSADGRFSHHGKYWNFDDAIIDPRPLQSPHPPIWIGAASPSSIERAARVRLQPAAGSVQRLEPDRWPIRLVPGLRALDGCAIRSDAGRRHARLPPDAQRRGDTRVVGASPAGAREQSTTVRQSVTRQAAPVHRPPVASGDPDDTWLIGTPDQVVRRLENLKARGIEYVLLLDTTGDVESLERFAAEILPRFERAGASEAA